MWFRPKVSVTEQIPAVYVSDIPLKPVVLSLLCCCVKILKYILQAYHDESATVNEHLAIHSDTYVCVKNMTTSLSVGCP